MKRRWLGKVAWVLTGVTGVFVAGAASPAKAQFLANPKLKTTPPQTKQLVIENVYTYNYRAYRPAVKLLPLKTQKESSYQYPEDTVTAHISAMLAKDWNWFREGWDPACWKEIEQENKAAGRAPTSIMQRWEVLQGKQIQFVDRIDSGPFSVVYYTVEGQPGFLFAAMKLQNGKWLITNEFSNDPVLMYAHEGKTTIRNVVR